MPLYFYESFNNQFKLMHYVDVKPESLEVRFKYYAE